MQAVLESRDIQDIAKQVQRSMPESLQHDVKEREAGIITSYEISKITGEANCKVTDRIRRLVPRGRDYYYDTLFTSQSNCQFKALALTAKGLDVFIKRIEGQGGRCTQKQAEDIKKIKAAVGFETENVKPVRNEKEEREKKIREAVDNLVMADSFINVVEDRFIGRDYENLTYQEKDDFERLFYFMADQLHSRIGELKALVES